MWCCVPLDCCAVLLPVGTEGWSRRRGCLTVLPRVGRREAIEWEVRAGTWQRCPELARKPWLHLGLTGSSSLGTTRPFTLHVAGSISFYFFPLVQLLPKGQTWVNCCIGDQNRDKQ